MTTNATPANQKRRIATLRIAALLLIPLFLLTRPAWSDGAVMPEVMEPLGALMVIAGVLGRFWAMLYIGGRKNGMVMMDGPYSVCRHPLYLSSTVAATGLGLMLGSLTLTVLIGGATYLILFRTAHREEVFLRATFPERYASYAERVPAIWPRPQLFTTPPKVTFDVATLRTNLFDALVFLSFLPLAEGIEGLRLIPGLGIIPLY